MKRKTKNSLNEINSVSELLAFIKSARKRWSHIRRTKKACASSGMTLVEIIMAILILAVLAIAGASATHMSRRTLVIQRNRREAIGIAHHRLEKLRASQYSALAPSTLDYTAYYVTTNSTGALVVQPSDPSETIVIGGTPVPMETRLQYVDIDGDTLSFDGLRLYVSVGYHADPNDRVELETFYADDGELE